jgi:hypothetical protein
MTITLTEKTTEEIEKSQNLETISLNDLLPEIKRLARVRQYENIDGLIISPQGEIKVAISLKVGRRPKQIEES